MMSSNIMNDACMFVGLKVCLCMDVRVHCKYLPHFYHKFTAQSIP